MSDEKDYAMEVRDLVVYTCIIIRIITALVHLCSHDDLGHTHPQSHGLNDEVKG